MTPMAASLVSLLMLSAIGLVKGISPLRLLGRWIVYARAVGTASSAVIRSAPGEFRRQWGPAVYRARMDV